MYVCMYAYTYIVYTYILCLHGLWIRRCHACGRWVLSRGGVGVAVTPQALLGLRVLGFRGLGVWRLVFLRVLLARAFEGFPAILPALKVHLQQQHSKEVLAAIWASLLEQSPVQHDLLSRVSKDVHHSQKIQSLALCTSTTVHSPTLASTRTPTTPQARTSMYPKA